MLINKLNEVLVATTSAHYNTAFVYFDKDFLCAKQVEPIAKAPDRQSALHLGQIVTDHLIDQVTFDGTIVSA